MAALRCRVSNLCVGPAPSVNTKHVRGLLRPDARLDLVDLLCTQTSGHDKLAGLAHGRTDQYLQSITAAVESTAVS
jgi:hypothetical protein